MCLECRAFKDEPITSDPHALLSLRRRFSSEGMTIDYLCTDCGRIWIEGVEKWELKTVTPRPDTVPDWGEAD